jgi:hypothetical protein
MRKKLGLLVVLTLIMTLVLPINVFAAKKSTKSSKTTTTTTTTAVTPSMTINYTLIQGNQVLVIATGATNVPSPDGAYYLFELKPYETAVGARVDYCAAGVDDGTGTVQFTTDLNNNTASSKLYSRFVVTTLQNGVFTPVSNEMYITNPEALATKATANGARSRKGLTADWRYASNLKDLNAGYASYEIDISRFCTGGGTSYTYNGKTYSFNSSVVAEYDAVVKMLCDAGTNVIMVIKNSFNNGLTADLIAPTGRVAGYNCYALNVDEQGGTEKIAALMSFLANRYSGGSNGTISNWIIGNEVNNNNPWHYLGNVTVDEFAAHYAKEVRLCYNAIKSQNSGANVYINIDQRWTHTDSNTLAYKGKEVLDKFAADIKTTGDIDWGLSFHPHPVPLFNATFWSLPAAYQGMNLVTHDDNSKMVCPTNLDVIVNHMTSAELLSPSGTVRHMMISEMGITSVSGATGASLGIVTDENIQAAAMVYAYKLAAQYPSIEAIVIHRQIDHDSEIISDGMAVGIMSSSGTPKQAYSAFKIMDTGDTSYLLPFLGATSWADLGVN